MNCKLKMKQHKTTGTLITLCGLDGCGKSTMIERVFNILKDHGKDVLLTKQPTDTMRKTDIFRTFMDNPDNSAYEYRALSLMAAADRIQHCNKVILPALERGAVVISDRYFFSCLANLRARGYKNDRWIYELAKDIPKPDYSFFLDVPVEAAISRVRQRPLEKERYIDIELQHKLRDEYSDICKKAGGISVSSEIGEDETFFEIWKHLFPLVYGGERK